MSTAQTTITVTDPPPAGGGDPEPTTPEPTTPDPTTPDPTTPEPTTPEPTTPEPTTPGPGPTPPGGDGRPPVATPPPASPLTLIAPKRFRLGARQPRLAIGVKAARAGRLSLTLVRRGRVVAGLDKAIRRGSSLRKIRLPRRLRAGGYVLKYAFTPAGAAPVTGRMKIGFVRPRAR